MAMRPCEKCLENNWSFKTLDDGWIQATCNMCWHEVEWEKKKQTLQDKAVCVKCGGTIHFQKSKFKESKLLKPYYYTGYFRCDKCKSFYMSDEFKVITGVKAPPPDGYKFNEKGEIVSMDTR